MKIRQPLCITSRLLPGVEIGGATISIEYDHVTSEGRQAYGWFIDGVSGENWSGENLVSRVGGGTLQEGMESLLSFLDAFASAIEWLRSNPEADIDSVENADLFPAGLADWAIENIHDLAVLEATLQERPGEFIIE